MFILFVIRKTNTEEYLWDMNVAQRDYKFATFDEELPGYNWCIAWPTKEGCEYIHDLITKCSQFLYNEIEVVEL